MAIYIYKPDAVTSKQFSEYGFEMTLQWGEEQINYVHVSSLKNKEFTLNATKSLDLLAS